MWKNVVVAGGHVCVLQLLRDAAAITLLVWNASHRWGRICNTHALQVIAYVSDTHATHVKFSQVVCAA